MKRNRILVLAPHTDDGELGCGASINRFVEEGSEVFYAAFSKCSRSLPPHLDPNTLFYEVMDATTELGIPKENVIVFDFDVRLFPTYRQEILEEMLILKKNIKPDMIFVPSPTDIHQDHQVISNEGLRAFKSSILLGYEMPWNNISFDTRCFIKVEEKHVDTKIKALRCYKSQAHRTYLSDEFLKGLASVRGVQIGAPYAESFEVIRTII